MGAHSFLTTDLSGSKSVSSLRKYMVYRSSLNTLKDEDCLVVIGRLFQRSTIRLKYESLHKEVRKPVGRKFRLDDDHN